MVDFARIRLLVLDVDGVLTNGTKIYTPLGVLGKSFFERDFTAMKQFEGRGTSVVCMTSDPMNIALLQNKSRHIKVVLTKSNEKLDTFKCIMDEYQVTMSEAAYVGDDLEDLPVLRYLVKHGGVAITPLLPHPNLLNDDFTCITEAGGEGVVEQLYWLAYKGDDHDD
jgi:3-deoxy-D-manno-octulosonate 8-phosphate phosphatase (KDO 8-P phosphatase)